MRMPLDNNICAPPVSAFFTANLPCCALTTARQRSETIMRRDQNSVRGSDPPGMFLEGQHSPDLESKCRSILHHKQPVLKMSCLPSSANVKREKGLACAMWAKWMYSSPDEHAFAMWANSHNMSTLWTLWTCWGWTCCGNSPPCPGYSPSLFTLATLSLALTPPFSRSIIYATK